MEFAAQEVVALSPDIDAIVANALYRVRLALVPRDQFGLLRSGIVRHQLRLDGIAWQIEVAQVNVIVDVLRRGVPAGRVVDYEQPAGLVREKHRPVVK